MLFINFVYYFSKHYCFIKVLLLINVFGNIITDMSKLERKALLHKMKNHLVNFYNYTWLFLEIHMQKIVFISFVLLCINDVSGIIIINIILFKTEE